MRNIRLARWIAFILIFSLCVTVAIGCTSANNNEKEDDYSDQQITIYTSYNDEQNFYQMYGNLILERFPGLNIRLITSTNIYDSTEIENLLKQSPDLIFSFTDQYKKMRDNSFLMELDTQIKRENYDLEHFQPEMIKALCDDFGKLYGLSPNVNIFGVFYNKELFDRYNLDYPIDGIDWYGLLKKSGDFKDGAIGFESTFSAPNNLLMKIANSNRLNFVDESRRIIDFKNKEKWHRAIQAVIEIHQSKSIANGTGELFLKGKSALYPSSVFFSKKLSSISFPWGFISNPVNSENEFESGSIALNQVISIPQTSTQKELSWEIIKELMSENSADFYINNRMLKTIPTLKSYANKYNGIDLTNIWDHSSIVNPGILPENLSTEFLDEFYDLLDKSLLSAINQETSVEQCLKSIIEETSFAYEKEKLRNDQR